MLINRGMDKDDVVCTYKYTMGYYSAIKKEWDNAICGDIDATRDYHIKWSQKEKGKYLMISLYVESKIWHKRIYLWNRNRVIDIENRLMVACVEGSERFRVAVVSYYMGNR